MRNLKRVLSLALASLMLMGMMVVGAGAASKDFTDADEIKNVEAVDVMVALGVLEGGDKGDFQPNSILTREQAAKIICYLLLGEENAEKLTTNYSIFSDVPANRWSAPYISYCVNLGILAGDGNGHFFPEGKLTGVAFAKMLLVCLGYNAERENYVGNNWEINTSAAAIAAGIAPKELDLSKELSRDNAALMAFNTLQGTMVEYLNDNTIIIGGETIVSTTGKASAVAQSPYTDTMHTEYLQFAEKYFGKLKKLSDTDAFYRPVRVWNYNGNEIGAYAKDELLVGSYTTGVTGKDLYDLLGSTTIRDNDLYYYVDGTADTTTITKANMARSNTETYGTTGNGVLTEVYLDTTAKEITIVSINTYLAQATGDYSSSKEYAPMKVYVTNGKSTTTYNVDVEDVAAVKNVVDGNYYLTNISYKDSTKGQIVALQDAEVLSNSTITKFSASSNGDGTGKVTSLTTDGTKYSAAQKSFYDADILDKYNNSSLTNATYNVYLDQYGYFIGVDLYEGAKNYVFITGYDRPESNLTVKTADAAAIFLDGSMQAIKVNVTDTNRNIGTVPGYTQWTGGANDGKYNENRWYSYTVSESGVYTLKPVAMTATEYNTADTIKTSNVSIQGNMSQDFGVTGNKNARVYGQDESVYLTVSKDIVDTSNGQAKAITEVTGTYTGVQNVTLDVYNKTTAGNDCSVYTVYDEDYYIIGAIVLGEAQGSKSNIAYILSRAKSEEKIGDTYYWEFDAVVGGQIQTLTAKSKYPSTIDILEGEMTGKIGITSYTGNADRLVELRFDGDYVTKINDVALGDIYTNYTNKINGEDVYLLADGSTYEAAQLTLKGRTLYVTNNQTDMGLALTSDAKAVVIQPENGPTNIVKTEFDSVSGAINYLADPNDKTTALEYDGTIVAALDSNGAAQWVVFVSKTELVTGSNKPSTKADYDFTNLAASVSSKKIVFTGSTTPIDGWKFQNAKVEYTVSVNGGAERTFTQTIAGGTDKTISAGLVANMTVPGISVDSSSHDITVKVLVTFTGLDGKTYTIAGTSYII